MGNSTTAIRVGDDFLLAHYPESGKLYSIQHGDEASRSYTLEEGGEQALLLQIVEQILISGIVGSR
jgi:hypothetical protein